MGPNCSSTRFILLFKTLCRKVITGNNISYKYVNKHSTFLCTILLITPFTFRYIERYVFQLVLGCFRIFYLDWWKQWLNRVKTCRYIIILLLNYLLYKKNGFKIFKYLQGYVTELLLTLEAAVDSLESDFRPLDFRKEIFKSTPNLNNKDGVPIGVGGN